MIGKRRGNARDQGVHISSLERTHRRFVGDQMTDDAQMPLREPVDDTGEESGRISDRGRDPYFPRRRVRQPRARFGLVGSLRLSKEFA